MIVIVRICYSKATNGEQITVDTNKSFKFKDVAWGTSIWAPTAVLPGRCIPNHGFPFKWQGCHKSAIGKDEGSSTEKVAERG